MPDQTPQQISSQPLRFRPSGNPSRVTLRLLTLTTLLTMGLFSFFGCSKQTPPPQKISLPSTAESERLTQQRAVIERFLGDAFVQELGMEWITVQDEHGTDPAVRMPGTSIIIYPLTMISKQVERGETVDVFDLFNGTADQIDQLKKK